MPSREAGTTPKTPIFVFRILTKRLCILSLPELDIEVVPEIDEFPANYISETIGHSVCFR
jgi:hypothetical protein